MRGEYSSLCVNRINAVYDNLSTVERRIADYILQNYETLTMGSCAGLAAATKTSPASIVRFCRKIGFSGFTELKMSISQSWIDQRVGQLNISREDTISEIKQKVLMFNKSVIDGMFTTLNEHALEEAASLLCHATRVVIIGDGGSSCSARNAYDIFLQLRIRCEYVTDPFFQIMVIGQLEKDDVVFAISNSGRSKNTIENLKQAKEQNITTIGIVGVPNSPASKYLDVELRTNIFESDFFCDSAAAQICELSAIAVLHSLILTRTEKDNLYVGHHLTNAFDAKRVNWKSKL